MEGRLYAIVLVLLATVLPMSCSIRSNPNNHPTTSQFSNDTSFILPMFHRSHPKVKRYLGDNDNDTLVEVEPGLSVAPIEADPTRYVFYVEFLVAETPAMAVFDTGSFFTWLRVTPSYDPTRSLSFIPLPCRARLCGEVPSNAKCTPDRRTTCRYQMVYADGTSTDGDVGIDTISVYKVNGAGHDPASRVEAKLVFGAGTGGSNAHLGIMGVSVHPLGLLTALKVAHFSACFPREGQKKSYLRLGIFDSQLYGVRTTLREQGWKPAFRVAAIIVGGARLTNLTSGFKGGGLFIFDTGASLTNLHPVAFEAVVDEIKEVMVGVQPLSALRLGYELCYDQGWKLALQEIGISFELDGGSTIDFDFPNLWVGVGGTMWCLAFHRTKTYWSVFGAKQMEGSTFGFDYHEKQMYYNPATTDCV